MDEIARTAGGEMRGGPTSGSPRADGHGPCGRNVPTREGTARDRALPLRWRLPRRALPSRRAAAAERTRRARAGGHPLNRLGREHPRGASRRGDPRLARAGRDHSRRRLGGAHRRALPRLRREESTHRADPHASAAVELVPGRDDGGGPRQAAGGAHPSDTGRIAGAALPISSARPIWSTARTGSSRASGWERTGTSASGGPPRRGRWRAPSPRRPAGRPSSIPSPCASARTSTPGTRSRTTTAPPTSRI